MIKPIILIHIIDKFSWNSGIKKILNFDRRYLKSRKKNKIQRDKEVQNFKDHKVRERVRHLPMQLYKILMLLVVQG